MPERFNFSLGDIPILLIPDQISGEFEFVKRARDFQTQTDPEICLQVHCGQFPDLNGASVVFETDHGWRLLQMGDQWVIQVHSATQDPYQIGIFPIDFRSGDIYVARSEENPDRYIFPLSYPLGELYMMSLLGTGLGMLFHAAGVIDQGQGFLFVGHGGAGKTTTARLWENLPGVQVVNDDKVIVRKQGAEFYLYGTPWHGEGGMVLPVSAPLKHVFVLNQADHNYSAPIPAAEAAGKLLARTFVPLWDADKINFSLSFLDELVRGVPTHELGFLPNSSAVDFVRNL